MRSIHQGLLVSLATFALLMGLFGAAELLFRAFVPPEPGLDKPYLEAMLWAAGPCYRVESGTGKSELVEIRPPDLRLVYRGTPEPVRFPLAKTPGVKRIVVIGESSATMMENALANYVAQPDCAGRYEVFQCSVPGGNLRQTERRFEYALDYSPDAIVVIFGHNLYFSNPSDPVELRVQLLRSRSRLVSYLSRRLHPGTPPAFPNPADALPALDSALHRFADEAAHHHVTLVLNTMASNLWLHPMAFEDGEDENRPEQLEALIQDDLGQRDAAIATLRQLGDQHSSAVAELQLADWLYQRGDYSEARRHFERARDLDQVRGRASTAINERIRVAASPPVILRDTERALAASAPHGIPGWESFIDNCHLRPWTLDNEAAALLAAIPGGTACGRADAGGAPAIAEKHYATWNAQVPPAGGSRSQQTFLATVNTVFQQAGALPGARATAWWANLPDITVEALTRNGPNAAHWLDDALTAEPFTRLDPARQSKALTAIAEGFWRADWRDRAAELNERARAYPSAAEAWVQRGRWWLRLGRPSDALAAFETALQAVPSRRDAAYFVQRTKTLTATTTP